MSDPFRTTPNLGPDLTQIVKADQVWYDGNLQIGSPQLGTTVSGSDGRDFVWVEASGTISSASAPGTQVSLTVTGPDNITAAAGAGGFYAPVGQALAIGDRFWAAKGTAPLA